MTAPRPCAQECIPTSLLKLNTDNANRAVKMFAGIQKYMAEGGEVRARLGLFTVSDLAYSE